MELMKDLEFMVELEKMKKIFRRTWIIGEKRRENDAEHSWHIAVMGMLLGKYVREKDGQVADMDKVVKMLLIHDIVEIYAGDTFAYDQVGSVGKREREIEAMELIKEKLSPENAKMIGDLWTEFDEMTSGEAIFANAVDRLQPVLSNIYADDGGTWSEFGVTRSQIMKRIEPIESFSAEIYAYVLEKIEENIRKGFIKDE
ncbi:MAG: HD domain-containing protein [Bacillota bacterium]|nr:HD domain-containing protein [Bacillota bacterium]